MNYTPLVQTSPISEITEKLFNTNLQARFDGPWWLCPSQGTVVFIELQPVVHNEKVKNGIFLALTITHDACRERLHCVSLELGA